MTDETRPPAPGADSPAPGTPPSAPLPPAAPPLVPPGMAPAGLPPGGAPAGDWFQRLVVPAVETKGWLRFLGVMAILGGVLTALSIVGLLIAWLYIWVGVLLWQAGDRADQASRMRDPAMLEQYLQKLKTVIMIAGIGTAIGLVVGVLMAATGLAMTWLAFMAEHFH